MPFDDTQEEAPKFYNIYALRVGSELSDPPIKRNVSASNLILLPVEHIYESSSPLSEGAVQ